MWLISYASFLLSRIKEHCVCRTLVQYVNIVSVTCVCLCVCILCNRLFCPVTAEVDYSLVLDLALCIILCGDDKLVNFK